MMADDVTDGGNKLMASINGDEMSATAAYKAAEAKQAAWRPPCWQSSANLKRSTCRGTAVARC